MNKILLAIVIILFTGCSKEQLNKLNASNINDFHLVGLTIKKTSANINDISNKISVAFSLKNTEKLKSCEFMLKLPNCPTYSSIQVGITSPNSFIILTGSSTSIKYKIEYTYTDGKVIVSEEKLIN